MTVQGLRSSVSNVFSRVMPKGDTFRAKAGRAAVVAVGLTAATTAVSVVGRKLSGGKKPAGAEQENAREMGKLQQDCIGCTESAPPTGSSAA